MPITVRTHKNLPSNVNWTKADFSDKKNYDKYIETNPAACIKANTRLKIYNFLTLGLYTLFFGGKTDKSNIKKNNIIHYVKKSELPSTSSKTNKARTSTLPNTPSSNAAVTPLPPIQTSNLAPVATSAQATSTPSLQPQSTQKEPLVQPQIYMSSITVKPVEPKIDIAQLRAISKVQLKSAFSQVNELRNVRSSLDEVLKTKKDAFLMALAEQDPEIAQAVGQFFAKNSENPTQVKFLEAISAFLVKKDALATLKQALENTNKPARVPTESEIHYQNLKNLYQKHSDPNAWVISLKRVKAPEMFDFTCDLLKTLNQWDGLLEFTKLYKENPIEVQSILGSLNQPVTSADLSVKRSIEQSFNNAKKVLDSLSNIPTGLTHYKPYDYFCCSNPIVDHVIDKSIRSLSKIVDSANSLNPQYIKSYFNKNPDVDQLVHHIERAWSVHYAKMLQTLSSWDANKTKELKGDEKRCTDPKIIKAYNEIKIFQAQHRDTITLLKEAAALNALDGIPMFAIIANYVKNIESSTFIDSKPQFLFLNNFSNYLNPPTDYIALNKEIEKIEAMANET